VGVAGEVGDGAAQLLVDGPAERDDFDLAGLARGWGGAGEADQGFGGGVAASGVADLGEQPGGAHGAGAGQRGEDVAVGVGGELGGDLVLEVLICARIALSAPTAATSVWRSCQSRASANATASGARPPRADGGLC
jgi:hypothetical protein